ncbi:MAG: TIGR00159 family protein [Clostridia bacterium]|nr:diadenylate cyclase CdaA [Eubacteriales bacterium]NCC48349.1 TIGR00159 family protein [Clostridia bacterium]
MTYHGIQKITRGVVLVVSDNGDLLSDIGQFITDLFQDLTSGLLFFGGPFDIAMAVADILATTFVVYYILKILRDSRAWQLLKGMLMIIGFALLGSLIGLSTVGYLLNNTISVFAIAFVVIFQPELRRALETFGRSSFSKISSAIGTDETERNPGFVHNTIESIVRACDKMAETRTGALIIIERQTRLGELIEQENVVHLDAAVSATMLLQTFYKGSPLHDGAIVIRNGRITAARVHVPLSDTYHLRRDFGTRHRAAIGASELGDAIAVVVSEERGSISLALDGRLYTLDNADALRGLLHKLMAGTQRTGVSLSSLFRPGRFHAQRAKNIDEISTDATEEATAADPERKTKTPRKQRLLLAIASLAIAFIIWLYVQVTINPVESRSFTVPLSYRNEMTVEEIGYGMQIPLQSVQVTLMGRQDTINELVREDIIAYIDFAEIDEPGLNSLSVRVDTTGLAHLRPTYISPETVTINVWLE